MILKKTIQFHNIQLLCLYLIAFSLPYNFIIVSGLIAVMCIIWVISGAIKEKVSKLIEVVQLWIWPAFFLLHIIGLLYSENLNNGLFILEKRLSFLLLPLIIGTGEAKIKKKSFDMILRIFCASCAIACLLTILLVFFKRNFLTENFFYQNLSSNLNLHPTYLSLYLAFSLCISLNFLETAYKSQSTKLIKIYYILLISIYVGTLILLASRVVFLVLMLLMSFFLIILLVKRRHQRREVLMYLTFCVIFVSLIVLLVRTNPLLRERLNELLSFKFTLPNFHHDANNTGINMRILHWKVAVKVLEDDFWLGVGTGDAQAAMDQMYTRLGYYNFVGLNSHNQYFDIGITLGILGITLILFAMGISILLPTKPRCNLYFVFLFLCYSVCMTESIFAREKGIVFFMFFYSIFVAFIIEKRK